MRNFYEQHLKPYVEDDLTVICAIFLFALFLRLMFLAHLIYDPAFVLPIVDCKEHNQLAFELLNQNNWRLTKFGYHTPGYAYFVAVVYKILGHSVVRLAVIQYVLGSLCACLVYYMIKRLMDRCSALFGAFLMSVYWMLIYTQSHVYSENLSMLLNLSMVCLLMFSKDSWHKYSLGGLLLGLSVVVRPEMSTFAVIFIVWIVMRRLSWKRALLYYLLFILGASLSVVPLLIRNKQLSGEFLIRQQIGVNLFMGSMPEYKGSNIYISVGTQWDKIIRMPFRELDKTDDELSEKERNAFYQGKVFDYIKNHPVEWSKFMAAKVFSVLAGIDFLRSEDVYFYDKFIRQTPFTLIQTWFICILAVIGILLSFLKDPRKYSLLYVYFGAYLFAMVFTYKTRYLVAHMPLIIIFASFAFYGLVEAIKRNNEWLILGLGSFFLALFLGVIYNPIDIVWPSQSEMNYVIAMNFDYHGDYPKAEGHFKKAIEIDPENKIAYVMLGNMYINTGEYQKAASLLETALKIIPGDQWISNLYNDAIYYMRSGGAEVYRENLSDEALFDRDPYRYYFRYPYEGPVYQKS